MKTIPSITAAIKLMFTLTFILFSIHCLSQDEPARASSLKLQASGDLPKAELRQTIADTVLPTLCNDGDGLIQVDYSHLLSNPRKCSQKKETSISSNILMENYTESEINSLLETERFMERQSVSDIQAQIRKNKMDLNLGDAIRGFYVK